MTISLKLPYTGLLRWSSKFFTVTSSMRDTLFLAWLSSMLRDNRNIDLTSVWSTRELDNLMCHTTTLDVINRGTLINLLTRAEVKVNGILSVNDDTLYVNWCYRDEALTFSVASSMTNVVLAVFTTAQARLKLFDYLHYMLWVPEFSTKTLIQYFMFVKVIK
ncbi:hypothetical protein TSAR_016199, partial [Trichomalopsis sarcophagae]